MAGAAYFVTAAALLQDSDGGDVIVVTAIAGGVLFAGMGGAGVGIDALIARRQVIYQNPGGGSRVSVSPLLGHGRRGAALSVTF